MKTRKVSASELKKFFSRFPPLNHIFSALWTKYKLERSRLKSVFSGMRRFLGLFSPYIYQFYSSRRAD